MRDLGPVLRPAEQTGSDGHAPTSACTVQNMIIHSMALTASISCRSCIVMFHAVKVDPDRMGIGQLHIHRPVVEHDEVAAAPAPRYAQDPHPVGAVLDMSLTHDRAAVRSAIGKQSLMSQPRCLTPRTLNQAEEPCHVTLQSRAPVKSTSHVAPGIC